MNTVQIFLSTVTDEFRSYRDELAAQLDRPGVRVETQEKFLPYGETTLLMLDDYIAKCDAVIHIVGDQTGATASTPNVAALLQKHVALCERLGLEDAAVADLTYTQWEALLAIFHGKKLFIPTPAPAAPRDKMVRDPVEAEQQRKRQEAHLSRLCRLGRYAENALRFANVDKLVISLLRSKLHDLLPTASIPVNLPPSLGSLFKGREDWLVKIRQALKPATEGQLDAARVALWGMGGLGKTQLAVEYAHTFAHEQSALLIVSAETPAQLSAKLAELTGVLKLSMAGAAEESARLRAVHDWLDDPSHRGWLLIIDNVDNEEAFAAVEERLRSLRHGQVLITSRLRQWPLYVKDLHLDLLPHEASVDYLLDATANQRVTLGGEADRRYAAELVKKVGGLALGLVQATGNIRARCLSIADYLADWEENRAELLDDPDFDPRITGYPRTVAVTWLTSVEQLPPEARVLLEVLSWLAAAPIPERWFTRQWPEQALGEVPDDARASPGTRRALVPLYNYCLAEPLAGRPGWFAIHRLVQEVGRIRQKKAGVAGCRLTAAIHLAAVDFVRPFALENLTLHALPDLRPLVPHMRELVGAVGLGVSPEAMRQASCLQVELSQVAWSQGLLAEAEAESQSAVATARTAEASLKASREARLSLVMALSQCADCLATNGRFSDAAPLGIEAVTRAEGLHADWPEDPEIQRNLAIALVYLGKIRERQGAFGAALEFFTRSLAIREKLVEREPDNFAHLHELSSDLSNVGRIREKQGALSMSQEVFTRSLAIQEKLVEREPDNLAHLRHVAVELAHVGLIRQQQGEVGPALEVLMRSLVIFLKLAEREPDNLARLRDVAVTLAFVGGTQEKQGALVPALEVFARSQAIQEKLLEREPDNLGHLRDLAIALNNVGEIRERQGELGPALESFVRSLAVREKLVEREPDNLARRFELAISLYWTGRATRRLGEIEKAVIFLTRAERTLRLLQDQAYAHGGLARWIAAVKVEQERAERRQTD